MIKNIRSKDIIKTEQFIREPVDLLSEEINESSSKKIILTGGRGIGKSVILHNIKDKGIGTENQTILIQLDSIINFSINPNSMFNEQFFKHYYELVFSRKLLSYIRDNYALAYDTNFKSIDTLLDDNFKETVHYINNRYYDEYELQNFLVPKEISSEIIEKMKKYFKMDTLTLEVDRFDWMNGSSSYTQQIISKYFDLFDKTIITSDDLSLEDRDRKKELESRGYSFITPKYGKNVNVIKQIIRKRIKLYNEDSKIPFDENAMTNKIYNNLVNQSNGNISLMLDTFGEITDLLNCREGDIRNLEDEFDTEMSVQLNKQKQLRKMDANPPKLHL